MTVTVKDLLGALDDLTGGRCLKNITDSNDFSMVKSSEINGKEISERPGLIWGDPNMEVKKVAVMMTMTESAIELAAATGVDAIVAHHPIADAASSGGVLVRTYLDLYNLAAFELHEAFHGLHPGIPWLHGHKPNYVNVAYGGIHGNIVYVGETIEGVNKLGDMVDRLEDFMNTKVDEKMLREEKQIRNSNAIEETSIAARPKILLGQADSPVENLLHIFPHTGFTPEHLQEMYDNYPEIDTVLATISRVYPGHELIEKAEELGLNFICGNSHALEIYENGIPMAYAIRQHLPELEVVIFHDRLTSVPLDQVGSDSIRKYGEDIASKYLKRDCGC